MAEIVVQGDQRDKVLQWLLKEWIYENRRKLRDVASLRVSGPRVLGAMNTELRLPHDRYLAIRVFASLY